MPVKRSNCCFRHPRSTIVDTLIRLADINLYLGDLDRAAECGHEALAEAQGANVVARCKGIIGATEFFGGDVDAGERWFMEAMTSLSIPANRGT